MITELGNGTRLAEGVLRKYLRKFSYKKLGLESVDGHWLPRPREGQRYTLYAHIPFCELLCPYCSFNRYPYREHLARRYFKNLRREMRLVESLGYRFKSLYIGGGTPTILIDELIKTIELAKELFGVEEVSTETNPNHLNRERLGALKGLVDRLSVGVQSMDNGLLKRMHRYEKYGSQEEIMERLQAFGGYLPVLNVDMIFNFPGQTEEMVLRDLELLDHSNADQVTFYPLMVSPSVEQSLKDSLGIVDYAREARLFQLINQHFPEKFRASSAWAFDCGKHELIDEYIVDYDEYVGVGSGAFSYLDGVVYSNTFSLQEYDKLLEEGRVSVTTKMALNHRDLPRYHFMMRLFSNRLNKRDFNNSFGVNLERVLWKEIAFLRLAGAFSRDDREWFELSLKGRYLLVVLMREFFIGVNSIRDKARLELSPAEQKLHFGSGEACSVNDRCEPQTVSV